MLLVFWTMAAAALVAIGIKGGSDLVTGVGAIMALMTCMFA